MADAEVCGAVVRIDPPTRFLRGHGRGKDQGNRESDSRRAIHHGIEAILLYRLRAEPRSNTSPAGHSASRGVPSAKRRRVARACATSSGLRVSMRSPVCAIIPSRISISSRSPVSRSISSAVDSRSLEFGWISLAARNAPVVGFCFAMPDVIQEYCAVWTPNASGSEPRAQASYKRNAHKGARETKSSAAPPLQRCDILVAQAVSPANRRY